MINTPYDNGSKRLLDLCTQEFLTWLTRGALFTGRRSEEFQSVKIEADAMMEALLDDVPALVHVEVQSGPDPDMAQRMLEYAVMAYRRYQCPILSYVIYLRGGGEFLEPPLVRMTHDGKELLRFHYEVIVLRERPYEELLKHGLYPLALFALNGSRREVVEEILARVASLEIRLRREHLSLTSLFASLILTSAEDQEWLERKFAMLDDFLAEAPLYKKLVAKGREEGRTKGLQEGRTKGLQEGLQEGLAQGLEKGLEKGLTKGLQKGREEGVAKASKRYSQSLRQKIVLLFQARFPSLTSLAQEKVPLVKQPEMLEDLLLQVALTQTIEEARDCLLTIKQDD